MRNQLFALLLAAIATTPASAKFDGEDKSINATAHTLPQGGIEVGLASLAYGVTDNFQLRIPTVPLLVGSYSLNGAYRFELNPTTHIKALAGASYSLGEVVPNGGVAFTTALSDSWDISLGVSGQYSSYDLFSFKLFSSETSAEDLQDQFRSMDFEQVKGDRRLRLTESFIMFDHYTESGNVFYCGLYSLATVVGFTWAFETFHIGVGGIGPIIPIFPMGYFYWRI